MSESERNERGDRTRAPNATMDALEALTSVHDSELEPVRQWSLGNETTDLTIQMVGRALKLTGGNVVLTCEHEEGNTVFYRRRSDGHIEGRLGKSREDKPYVATMDFVRSKLKTADQWTFEFVHIDETPWGATDA
jgi:hypothetical protein